MTGVFVGIGLLTTPAAADPVADAHLRLLDIVEKDLVGLAEAMPADRHGFRPSGGAFADVRTFGEQIKHTAR